jgi:thymidine phosphorylase
MDSPLGNTVGNALEVREAVETLTPGGGGGSLASPRFRELCLALAAEGLVLAGRAADPAAARALSAAALDDGRARTPLLPLWPRKRTATKRRPRARGRSGQPAAPRAHHPARACRARRLCCGRGRTRARRSGCPLGGGRTRKEDTVDHRVGLRLYTDVGNPVRRGETVLAEIHAATNEDARGAHEAVAAAFAVQDAAPKRRR